MLRAVVNALPRARSKAPRALPPQEDRESGAQAGDHRALRLWLRLLTCTQLIERHVRARLRAEFSITLPRFDLKAQLARHPEGLMMNALSRRLMVTGGNVTGIVDQLAGEGLVDRRSEPGDRRATRVRLTRAGARAFAAMARAHEAWIVEALAGVGSREQAQLLQLLAKLKGHAPGAAGQGDKA